jgi:hypothetical protein
MKPINHLCPQCGFRLDPDNPSESVCPACGSDPHDGQRPLQDLCLATALEDAGAAQTLHTANEILGAAASGEPDVAYTPDPELDFAIDDAEGLLKDLRDGPVLVAGNSLVN